MSSTIEKQTLEELIFQTEHACDGKIIEGEEWRSAYLLIDSLDRTLLTGDYPESISLHTKIRNRYQELEETLGDLHQKTKSWWSHPFTSIEDFNKQIEDLSNWISEDEQRLFKNFSRETKKKATKELSNRNWERAVLHLSLSLGLELNYQLLGDRAYCLWKLGHNEASLRDFERALSLNPAWEEGYLRLGNVHFVAGEYEKAIEVYERGLQNLPETQRTTIEDALAEAKHADSQEKKLQGEIEYLSKRLAELGTNPSELTVEALLREFAERLRNSYETPARGCNQSRIVARLRAVITVIMHRCRFEGRGVVDSLELAREWSRYKERMIRFSLETVMRVGAMILNDIDANLADSRLPTRFSRFQTLRASLWKALYRLYVSPRIKETRNLLKEKLIFLLHITEADRSFDAIEERVSNLLETTCLELLVFPLLSLLENEASFVELVIRKATRRSQRKHLMDEDGFTAILRDDIQRELEDLCSELAEFKYRQEQRRNEELPSSTSTSTPSTSATAAAGEEERSGRALSPATNQHEVLSEAL